MPTTETVRTDYRRRKKKWKIYMKKDRKVTLSKKKPTPPAMITLLFVSLLLAPQNSLQIQVQISQKPWMRSVQFYYTYCYTKYRKNQSLK